MTNLNEQILYITKRKEIVGIYSIHITVCMKYNEDFVKAYWLFRGRKLHTLRDFGTYLGHNKFYHKSIYSKALEYEKSSEYQKD